MVFHSPADSGASFISPHHILWSRGPLTTFSPWTILEISLRKEVVQSKMSIGSSNDCNDKTTREVADC